MTPDLPESLVREVFSEFDLREIARLEPLRLLRVYGASLLVKVTASDGKRYVLKGYPEPGEELRLALELQEALAKRGYPTPRVQRSRDGALFVTRGTGRYAVHEFVPGVQGDWGPPAHQREQAARLLARLHSEARDLKLPGEAAQPGFYDELEANSRRMESLAESLAGRGDEVARAILEEADFLCSQFSQAFKNFSRSLYDSLPKSLIHGDFAPVNLMISGGDPGSGDVVSVLDFRPSVEIRSRDFIAGFECPFDGSSVKAALMRFLADYQDEAERHGFPLTEEEVRVIPEVYRISRLRLISWLADEGKAQRLAAAIRVGDRGEWEWFLTLFADLRAQG